MDAKLMAKLLRQALAERNIELSHSDSLELLARQFGVANWNILSAKIEAYGIAHELVPKAWSKSGNNPSAYRINVDQTDHAAVIESKPGAEAYLSEADFCTLMQAIDASDYRGKRTRLRCQIKSVGVSGGVTPWFRVDGPAGSSRFENLERSQIAGPINGNTDWTIRTIVFDVPEDAVALNFGFYLKGSGRGLARAIELTEVSNSIPLNMPDSGVLRKPTNLDFSA